MWVSQGRKPTSCRYSRAQPSTVGNDCEKRDLPIPLDATFFVIPPSQYLYLSSIALPPPPNYTYCQDPRPQICTMDYTPVSVSRELESPRLTVTAAVLVLTRTSWPGCPVSAAHRSMCVLGSKIDCSLILLAPKPSCGFKPGATYTNTLSTVCCVGGTYSQFLRYACPIAPADPKPLPPPIVDPSPPTTSGKFTMCPPGPRQQGCNKMLQWTCGFKFKGLPQNYANTCIACADEAVFGYIHGNCSEVVSTCTNRLDCRTIKAAYIPSCAFEKGKAPYNVNNNLCCRNSTYDQVITGECPTIEKPTASTACPAKQSSFCPEIYRPVCGLLRDNSHRTYSNSCMACADKRVKSYVDGQC